MDGSKTSEVHLNKDKFAKKLKPGEMEDLNIMNNTKRAAVGDKTLSTILSYCKPYCTVRQGKFSEDNATDKKRWRIHSRCLVL